MKKVIGIAGAGFGGAVLARELVESGQYKVVVFDERKHVAGNCHTVRDAKTNVMVHEFGPHIFNTSREDVWNYVQKWGEFKPFVNRVKAHTSRGVFSLPINLLTINQFFQKKLNPQQARDFVGGLGDRSIKEASSFEEQALKFIGRDLYEAFFAGYSRKQWGTDPKNLPASTLQRLPVRFNYDDNYYNQKYQGIPTEGYTKIVEKILEHPEIEVRLGQRLDQADIGKYEHVFWSGPIDGFYKNEFGKLRYRTLNFERFDDTGDFQGNAVINYCEESVPYTRITEHKHFAPWESHEGTVCFKEFSKLCEEGETPYYPLRLEEDKKLLVKYIEKADQEKNVTFIGRLGTYRYLDMHVVIGESLDLAKKLIEGGGKQNAPWPAFSNRPL